MHCFEKNFIYKHQTVKNLCYKQSAFSKELKEITTEDSFVLFLLFLCSLLYELSTSCVYQLEAGLFWAGKSHIYAHCSPVNF